MEDSVTSPACRVVRGITIESCHANMPSSRIMHALISKELPLLMRKQVHTRRTALVLTALVIAAAFPMTFPSREHAASAEVVMVENANAMIVADRSAAATIPSATFTGDPAGDESDIAAETAAMMLVGTLLIGIGSVVRRVA